MCLACVLSVMLVIPLVLLTCYPRDIHSLSTSVGLSSESFLSQTVLGITLYSGLKVEPSEKVTGGTFIKGSRRVPLWSQAKESYMVLVSTFISKIVYLSDFLGV